RPTEGIKSANWIQFKTSSEGIRTFRAYWIHEWDGKGYDLSEHINNLDQAINRATELGYQDDVKKLEGLK
ncbi:hypothetical protein ACFLTO_06680, partial [Chloroflexota bacterium]